ncbi:MAG TPA: ribonuclease III [Candidatus Binatia bacterium]|nr:ribonuclease III [Candidatus Binatia bacterium]
MERAKRSAEGAPDDLAAVAEALEERLGYGFGDRALLRTALTHRSHTAGAGEQNETLEFLGDAVIGLVVSDLLVRRWPLANEGQLSRRRAALVNADSLAAKASGLGLGPVILLGRGEEKTGGRAKRSILAGAFEAVLGAVFLDGGFDAARRAIELVFREDVAVQPGAKAGEYKTRLQELTQRLFRQTPEYTLRSVSGPDHARDFLSEVRIQGRLLGTGSGHSKKVAEQAAAREALQALADHEAAVDAGAEAQIAEPATRGAPTREAGGEGEAS